jgi:hypothetical protein
VPPQPTRDQTRVGNWSSFVDARLEIINDSTAPAGDRRRAMEKLESRALGRRKETVEQVTEEPEELQAMRAMTPEERRILLRMMNEAEAAAAAEAEDSEPTNYRLA